MNHTDLRSIEEVQQLTQEYASYSRSRNGLGNVLGGGAGLAICLANGLFGPGMLTTIFTIGLTVVWLVGKEVMRKWLYRRFGEAQEVWPKKARRWHIGLVISLTLIIGGVCIAFIVLGGLTRPQGWLYLFFAVVMPCIAWRYLRTSAEFIVGVFLLCACAVTSVGSAYGLAFSWWAALASLLMLLSGIYEHRKFLRLVVHLQAQRVMEE